MDKPATIECEILHATCSQAFDEIFEHYNALLHVRANRAKNDRIFVNGSSL
jgi:hypothetical protein